jgi:hypothetical protein
MQMNGYRTFAGVKMLREIREQCDLAGVSVDDYGHRTRGSDYVCIGVASKVTRKDGTPIVLASVANAGGYVMFNTFNGTFFGHTHEGVSFHSSTDQYEHEDWFKQLLAFFYREA